MKTAIHPNKIGPIEAGIGDVIYQLHEFLVALRHSPGRSSLALLVAATMITVAATAAAQVSLNAWNGPFYEAIAQKNVSAFLLELLVFAGIASGLLVLNVAQALLREMIKLNSREWLTRDLIGEWVKPGRHARLASAGEIGVNPDQRIHEDARRLTELSADLGIGLLQALVLLLCFLGVLWTVAGELNIWIGGVSLPIPGYMVWCAPLRRERIVAHLACWPPPRGLEYPSLSARSRIPLRTGSGKSAGADRRQVS